MGQCRIRRVREAAGVEFIDTNAQRHSWNETVLASADD